jgi:hypothetical protein
LEVLWDFRISRHLSPFRRTDISWYIVRTYIRWNKLSIFRSKRPFLTALFSI